METKGASEFFPDKAKCFRLAVEIILTGVTGVLEAKLGDCNTLLTFW
jgi:hypothetical protein